MILPAALAAAPAVTRERNACGCRCAATPALTPSAPFQSYPLFVSFSSSSVSHPYHHFPSMVSRRRPLNLRALICLIPRRPQSVFLYPFPVRPSSLPIFLLLFLASPIVRQIYKQRYLQAHVARPNTFRLWQSLMEVAIDRFYIHDCYTRAGI